MSLKKSVAKNAVTLMGTQLITWGMSMLLTIFLPRFLGPSAIGKYHFSGSIWVILSMVASLGMDTYLTKEAARRPEQVPGLIWSSVILRSVMFLLCLGGLAVYLEVMDYPAETRSVAFVIGAASLVWLLISIVQSILVGYEQVQFVSLGNIVGRAVNTILCITLLLLGQNVVVVATVNTVSALATLAIEFGYLRKIVSIPFRVSIAQMWNLVRGGIPYFMSGIFLVMYMQFDFVIISLLVNDQAVGWYGAADQLFGTLLFVPTVLMTAVFPTFSRMYVSDADGLPRVTRKSFDLLVLLSIPIGLGVTAAARPTVSLLFGDAFAPTAQILAVMGVLLILTYLNVFIGQYLISVDRQNQWTMVMAVATIATLPLDLVLIPWCARVYANGGLGGALSFIVTESGMLLTGLWLMPRRTLGAANLWLGLRALAAGLLMVAAVWWIQALPILDIFRLGLIVLVGVATYGLAGWILRLISAEDAALVRNLVTDFLKKFNRRRASDETQAL